MSPPRALLFDVGNVLIDVDFQRAARVWANAAGTDWCALMRHFQADEAYQAHERGEIDWPTYRQHLQESLGMDLDDEVMLAGWNAILGEPYEGIELLIQQLPGSAELFAFSNTNAAHFDNWATHHSALFAPFDAVFCSHHIGQRKPDRAAFEHVLEAMGQAPENVLFFDDNHANVAAARSLGFRVAQISSPADSRIALVEAGLIGPS